MLDKLKNIIIKVTNNCNMQCNYCFVEENVPKNVFISLEIIEHLFDEIDSNLATDEVRIIWHGGEPLLAGIDFYKSVIDLQKKYKTKFSNSIQTNGLLLNREIAQFFKDNSFNIGLSIDGPKSINDLTRLTKTNKGSFEYILNTIKLLKDFDIPFGILATVTKHNVKHASSLYSFFKELGQPFKISSLYFSGNTKKNYNGLKITPKEYADFVLELASLWIEDSSLYAISVESFVGKILEPDSYSSECTFTKNCFEYYLAIGPTGNMYPCCLFQGYEDFKYGNIMSQSILSIINNPARLKMIEREKQIETICGSCEIIEYCNGGCPFSALVNSCDINNKDYYCSAYKKIIPELVQMISSKISEVQNEKERERFN